MIVLVMVTEVSVVELVPLKPSAPPPAPPAELPVNVLLLMVNDPLLEPRTAPPMPLGAEFAEKVLLVMVALPEEKLIAPPPEVELVELSLTVDSTTMSEPLV